MTELRAKLRIGLVGCGSLGMQHAKNIETIAGVELVAVSSKNILSAKSLVENINSNPVVYDSCAKMFKNAGLDAVLVVTPNDTHCQIVKEAAMAGIHIFCEKPLALTLADCDAMIEATEVAGVFLMTGYVRRFDNNYREMKRLIQAGKIGSVKMANISVYIERKVTPGKDWVLNRDTYGGLYSLYSHELDQLTWIFGDVKAVQAMILQDNEVENAAEQSSFIHLQFESGLVATLNCSRIYHGGEYSFNVTGSTGSLRIQSSKGSSLWCYLSDKDPEEIKLARNNSMLEELEYFFNCLSQKIAPESNGIDGRRTIKIAMAVQESAQTGKLVNLKGR